MRRSSLRNRRRAVVVGTLLVAAAAYVVLVLRPAMAGFAASSDRASALADELDDAQATVASMDDLEKSGELLANRASEIGSSIALNAAGGGLAPTVQALLEAANETGIELVALRTSPPLDSDETARRLLELEGYAGPSDFAEFIARIQGLRLDEFTLDGAARRGDPLRFLVRAAMPPSEDVAELIAAADGVESRGLPSVSDSLFAQPARPRPASPEPAPTSTEPVLNLVGVSSFGAGRLAVIVEPTTGRDHFVMTGGAVGGFVVEEITESTVTLRGEGGGRTLALSDTVAIAPAEVEDGAPEALPIDGSTPIYLAALGVSVIELPLDAHGAASADNERLLVVGLDAADSPLRVGDLLRSIGVIPIRSVLEAAAVLAATSVGTELEIGLKRGNQLLALVIPSR